MERLSGGSRHTIHRDGDVVRRPWQPWMPAVHALLRHLEDQGFAEAPRPVHDGPDAEGRAVWTYVEGRIQQPDPWPDTGVAALGDMIRRFHEAAATFDPPPEATWQRWWIHDIRPGAGIGHGELAPWNVVAVEGSPVALIDWEFAGPIDPVVDLAQAAWLNVRLFGDDVAPYEAQLDPETRARQLRLFLDGYGLEARRRDGFVDLMVEVAVASCAHEAEISGASPATGDIGVAGWAMAWRARSAAWMLRHRAMLEDAIG